MDKLNNLKKIAEEATQGKWVYYPDNDIDDWEILAFCGADVVSVKQDDSGVPILTVDGNHMATFSPHTILKMIEIINILNKTFLGTTVNAAEEYDKAQKLIKELEDEY